MINKATIVGRIGNIDYKQINGNNYTKVTIATNEYWKDKEGNKQEKTTWHNVCGFGKLAEIMHRYSSVGDVVYVEGRMSQNKYTGKDGVEKISHSITVHEYKIINSKADKNSLPKTENNGNLKTEEPLFLDDDIPF